MNDEIKEILDRLDYNEWEVALYKVPITWSELYNIRDYIINLQDRIDKTIKLLDEFKQMNDETIKRLSGKTSISGMLKNDNSIYDLVKIILTGDGKND